MIATVYGRPSQGRFASWRSCLAAIGCSLREPLQSPLICVKTKAVATQTSRQVPLGPTVRWPWRLAWRPGHRPSLRSIPGVLRPNGGDLVDSGRGQGGHWCHADTALQRAGAVCAQSVAVICRARGESRIGRSISSG